MVKKYRVKGSRSNHFENIQNNTSFSNLLDAIDPEREAQRQEYLRRISEKIDFPPPQARPSKPKKSRKPKGMSFDEKLKITQQWLEETFPTLFASSHPCKPLDIHIVRDIKNHYKQHHLKKNYPKDLVIKAALYRYMESPDYLRCVEEGAPRYTIDGEIVGNKE